MQEVVKEIRDVLSAAEISRHIEKYRCAGYGAEYKGRGQ